MTQSDAMGQVYFSFYLPMKTVSENKLRSASWKARLFGQVKKGIPSARAQKEQAYFGTWKLKRWVGDVPPSRAVVRLTRHAPRVMDDDNLRGCLKAVRDGVAMSIGVDDGDPGVQWEYAQELSDDYAVRVEVRILQR